MLIKSFVSRANAGVIFENTNFSNLSEVQKSWTFQDRKKYPELKHFYQNSYIGIGF